MLPPPPRSTLFPYTTLFRSSFHHIAGGEAVKAVDLAARRGSSERVRATAAALLPLLIERQEAERAPKDRKSTRLNSSHGYISYAVFCLKKKQIRKNYTVPTT